MYNKTKIFIDTISIVALVSLSCSASAQTSHVDLTEDWIRMRTYTPRPTYTSHPAYTTQSTKPTTIEAKLSVTPSSSYTRQPTHTPREIDIIPTRAQLIRPVLCADIVKKHSNSTDLEWQEYVDSVQGRSIYFSGEVDEVLEDDRVILHSYNYEYTSDETLYNIPHDKVVRLNSIGWHVEGYGTIRDITFSMLWPMIHIDVNSETLIAEGYWP